MAEKKNKKTDSATVETTNEQNQINQENTQSEVNIEQPEVNVEQQEGNLEQQPNTEDKSFFSKVGGAFVTAGKKVGWAFSTAGKKVWRWTKRTFMGADKEISQAEKLAVENIESPLRQMTREFFRKKIAVTALIILVLLFIFVFVGSLFLPMDVNLMDTTQANIAPTMSMLSVPGGLKNNVKSISSFSTFSVGVSNDHKFYMWGATNLTLQGINLKNYPEGFDPNNIYFAAAGNDHVVAIDGNGKVFVWGNNSSGQFGDKIPDGVTGDYSKVYILMPDEVRNGLDVSQVKQVAAGSSSSAILMKDGTLYVWGNSRGTSNLDKFVGETGIDKVAFSTSALVAIKNGKFTTGGSAIFSSIRTTAGEVPTGTTLLRYVSRRQCLDIAGGSYSVAMILDGGEVVVSGSFENGEDKLPTLNEGETPTQIAGGTRHYVLLTDEGNLYGWGSNMYGQLNYGTPTNVQQIYAGALQTYLLDGNDRIVAKAGLRGYLMGTDSLGRDVFTRIVHGGKMTMTVGVVAVIVSTVIAVIVGCLSGYFGGWVDVLLMRITEIFSSLPFLPMALMLSMVIRNYPVGETTRIIIIMVMLGLLSWTGLAQMIRGQVLAEREKEFVIAAKAMGIKETRIAFKHILPNVISVVLVSVTMSFAGSMLTESSLSYLGFGVQLPQPTWGNMLNGANNSVVIQNYWWQWLFPALFLSLATISINVIGDTLRDVLDPKSSLDK